VISWSCLGFGIGFISLLPFSVLTSDIQEVAFEHGIPVWLLLAYFFGPPAGCVAASVAMLRGRNWGRWMLLLLAPLRMLATFALPRAKLVNLLPEIVIYLLILLLLTRPAASAYFSARNPEEGQESIGR
jgi:hypothetical protein